MISIVIPLYNKEAYVVQTIQSVLDQKEQDFELIIVNDGSTDASEAVVKNFSDKRIKLHTIKNSGVSVARNTGISLATQPWIAFLDADDWWAPSFLTEMKYAIQTYTECQVFASGRTRVFKNRDDRYHNAVLPNDGDTAVLSYFEVISKDLPPINSSNCVIHQSVFSQDSFKKGMRQHEDHDLWIRICVNHPVVFVNKPLSFYRKEVAGAASGTQYSATDFGMYLDSMRRVLPTLKENEKTFFAAYCKKFIVVSFIQNYGHYTKKERTGLLQKIKSIIPASSYFVLVLLHHTSFVNIYQWYKKIKA